MWSIFSRRQHPLDSKNCLVGWDSTPSALQDLAIKARNGVLCVDDFVYPESTNRRSEFTNKAHEFLRAVANRSPKSRANNQGHSIECNLSLNCLVISTGEHAPRGVPESLHERGIYFPFNVGDLNLQMLERQQALAREGTFATANVAFIQHLLADYKINSNRANKWFEKARNYSKKKFNLSDRAASHMAAYIVGWAFFRKFAVSRGVITEAQSRTYRKHVNKHLGSLMRLQKEIYSPDAGELFVKALRNAFKEGKAFVKDSETGMQPTNVESSKVGWHDNKPQGLWIGWRRPKQQDIFIRDDLDTDELIDLLPEHDKHHFSQGPKTFWKSIKRLKRLNCPESDRNTTRKTFPGANSNNHYHIIMKISDEPEVSKKKSRQQEKKYQKSTPETTAETKIKSSTLHVETVSADAFLPDSKFPDFDQTSFNDFVQSGKGNSEFPTESYLAFD
jgi:hypothetical protein